MHLNLNLVIVAIQIKHLIKHYENHSVPDPDLDSINLDLNGFSNFQRESIV